MRLILIIPAFALAACASVPKPNSTSTPTDGSITQPLSEEHQSAPPTPESVDLVFGWKPGDRAHATVEKARGSIIGGEERTKKSSSLAFDLLVREHEEGLAILSQVVEVGLDELPVPGYRDLVKQSAEAMPTLVGRDGAFLRLEGAEAASVGLNQLFDRVVPADGPAAAFREPLRAALSPENLERRERDIWWATVDVWRDASLVFGEQVEFTDWRASAVRRVPCADDVRQQDCVLLRLETTIPQDQVEAAIGPFLKVLSEGSGQEWRVGESTNVIEITTEPATLRPWRMVHSQKFNMESQAGGGSATNRTVRSWTWNE